MSYAQALEKSWSDLKSVLEGAPVSIDFLGEKYAVNIPAKSVILESAGTPAKDYIAILVLHYLTQKLKLQNVPAPSGKWIDFNQIEGGEAYFPTFKKRTIDQIIKKYGQAPAKLLETGVPLKKADKGDVGVIIEPFEKVRLMVTLWKADEEFAPEANIVFDSNISKIFCMEDIVVLTEIVVHKL